MCEHSYLCVCGAGQGSERVCMGWGLATDMRAVGEIEHIEWLISVDECIHEQRAVLEMDVVVGGATVEMIGCSIELWAHGSHY